MNSTTLTSDCQELFSGHLKEFTRFTFEPNSLIFPDILSNLHRFVAYFVPLSRALGYTTTPPPICQHLFSCFFEKVCRRATVFILAQNRSKTLIFGSESFLLLLSFPVEKCSCFRYMDGDVFQHKPTCRSMSYLLSPTK